MSKLRKGFTLIELVVVIAIIAVLAAIILPNFWSYKTTAKEAVIEANLRTFYNGAEVVDKIDKRNIPVSLTPADRDFLENSGKYANVKDDTELLKYKVFKNNKGIYIEYHSDIIQADTGKGKIYRFPKGDLDVGQVETPGTIVDGVYIPTDDDFSWWMNADSNTDAYYAVNEIGRGFYYYTGSEKVVKVPDKIKGTTMNNLYRLFSNSYVEKAISTNPDVYSMQAMFRNSKSTSLDLSELNSSNVTKMGDMLNNTKARTLDLSKLDTSKVTTMARLFEFAEAKEINLGNIDTSKVVDMSQMFSSTRVLDIDISKLNTSSVTNMLGMFHGSSAQSINVDNVNTSKVTNMGSMFSSSEVLELDLSKFEINNETKLNDMFMFSQLEKVYVKDQTYLNRFRALGEISPHIFIIK